jgi:hypothetical protein
VSLTKHAERTSCGFGGKPWRCQAAHPGSIPTGVISGCRTKKNLIVVPHPLSGYDHPPICVVAELVVWIWPISDGRIGFRDFLDRKL